MRLPSLDRLRPEQLAQFIGPIVALISVLGLILGIGFGPSNGYPNGSSDGSSNDQWDDDWQEPAPWVELPAAWRDGVPTGGDPGAQPLATPTDTPPLTHVESVGYIHMVVGGTSTVGISTDTMGLDDLPTCAWRSMAPTA